MAVTSGTAANYRDLLSKIRDFVVSQPGWSQIAGQTGPIAADTDFISLRGTGLAGEDEFYVSMGVYSTPANNVYGLSLRGHSSYTVQGVTQGDGDSKWVYLPTLNTPIGYWVVCNGRRFIVIAKTSARYDVMYAGFMLPEHLPEDWAYPLMVGGSAPAPYAASVDSYSHSNFWNPIAFNTNTDNTADTTLYLFSPIRAWVPIRNGGAGSGFLNYTYTARLTVPWSQICNLNMRRLLDDTPYVTRGQIIGIDRNSQGSPETNMPEMGTFYGSFDGVYYTPAFGATAEQTFVIDGKTYMAVPNISRNTDGEFAAILME